MKYKKLIVTGCSYTENLGSWAYQLASTYNLELVNLAWPGAGNKHVLISLLSYLEKNEVDPNDTLIGIMWSHPIREDLVIEKNLNYEDQSIYGYDYDQHNCHVGTGTLLSKLNYGHRLVKIQVYKSMLYTNYNKAAMTLETWTYVESLVSYLKNNNYTFFQTVFLDYLIRSSLVNTNTDPSYNLQKNYSYLIELEKINLKQNKDGWIELKHYEYLGEYAFYTKKLASDNIHPSTDCSEQWTSEILIPKLKEMKILDT